MKKWSNKWTRAAIPALLLHCSIGTVYCWSILSGDIQAAFEAAGKSASALGWAFSLAIFFLGMSAAFLGDFVEKDIHKASLIATICFAAGIAGTALAVQLHSMLLVLLFYGVVMASSTCHNQLCVHMGEVTLDNWELRANQTFIICLPNRVTVELVVKE